MFHYLVNMLLNRLYLLNTLNICGLILLGLIMCEKTASISTASLSTTTHTTSHSETTQTNLNNKQNEPNRLVACDTHENCSSRVFSLDAYCCQSANFCCNWFEYSTNYQPSKSTLPFKSPSILTILMILLLIVCLLFVSYCFSILFCFCFKCGLFRRPKVVLISSGSLPSSNTESGLTTADLITSPKHSTSSSSGSSSSSYSSNRNRLRPKTKSHSLQHQQQRSKRAVNKSGSRQSPTARAYSLNSSHNRRPRDRTETELYIEYENDSPFLIPTQLAPATKTTSSRSRASDSSNRQLQNNYNTPVLARPPQQQPSAPLATDDFIINDMTSNVNRNLNSELNNVNRTVASLTSSITSSLGFGASLMEVIEQTNAEDNQARLQIASASNGHTRRDMQTNSAPSYYLDEKPPSYDVAVGAYQSYYNQF